MISVSLHEAIRIKDMIYREVLANPGVLGMDVGSRRIGNLILDEIVINVIINETEASSSAERNIPRYVQGVRVELIRTRHKFSPLQDMGRYDPIVGGAGYYGFDRLSRRDGTGTLGTIVEDRQTGEPLLLISPHDFLGVGSDLHNPPISSADRIAVVMRSSLGHANPVDAAVCRIVGPRRRNCEVAGIGNVIGPALPARNLPVMKRGMASGVTRGSIAGLGGTYNLNYMSGSRLLQNLIRINPDTRFNDRFGLPSDSGAVVLDQRINPWFAGIVGRHVVGLLIGDIGEYAIAHTIRDVENALDVYTCPVLRARYPDTTGWPPWGYQWPLGPRRPPWRLPIPPGRLWPLPVRPAL